MVPTSQRGDYLACLMHSGGLPGVSSMPGLQGGAHSQLRSARQRHTTSQLFPLSIKSEVKNRSPLSHLKLDFYIELPSNVGICNY